MYLHVITIAAAVLNVVSTARYSPCANMPLQAPPPAHGEQPAAQPAAAQPAAAHPQNVIHVRTTATVPLRAVECAWALWESYKTLPSTYVIRKRAEGPEGLSDIENTVKSAMFHLIKYRYTQTTLELELPTVIALRDVFKDGYIVDFEHVASDLPDIVEDCYDFFERLHRMLTGDLASVPEEVPMPPITPVVPEPPPHVIQLHIPMPPIIPDVVQPQVPMPPEMPEPPPHFLQLHIPMPSMMPEPPPHVLQPQVPMPPEMPEQVPMPLVVPKSPPHMPEPQMSPIRDITFRTLPFRFAECAWALWQLYNFDPTGAFPFIWRSPGKPDVIIDGPRVQYTVRCLEWVAQHPEQRELYPEMRAMCGSFQAVSQFNQQQDTDVANIVRECANLFLRL